MLAITIALSLLGLIGILATFFILKKKTSGGDSRHIIAELSPKIEEVTKKIKDILSDSEKLTSKLQLEAAIREVDSTKSNLENERGVLKGTEQKLEGAQQKVEEKESQQQDIKTSRAEDEARLAELLGQFQDISNEAVQLEGKLAESLKNLDEIMGGIQLTDEQRAVFTDLQAALNSAGDRLRELFLEYQLVHERLNTLVAQHHDLEEEYTKLVEQQLGE